MRFLVRACLALVLVWVSAQLLTERQCLGAQQSAASRNAEWSIGVGVRLDRFASQDGLVTPRPHSGIGASQGGIVLDRGTPTARHQFAVWFGAIDVANDAFSYQGRGGPRAVPDGLAELGEAVYTYTRRLGNGPWWLGAQAAVDVAHVGYEFGSGSADGFLYYGALGAAVSRDIDIGHGRDLELQVAVPLVAWAARTPYATVDEERLQASSDFFHRVGTGGLTGLPTLSAFRLAAVFTAPLTTRTAFRAAGRLGYTRHDDGEAFAAFRAGVDLGFSLRFGGGAQ